MIVTLCFGATLMWTTFCGALFWPGRKVCCSIAWFPVCTACTGSCQRWSLLFMCLFACVAMTFVYRALGGYVCCHCCIFIRFVLVHFIRLVVTLIAAGQPEVAPLEDL
jgi:hypothetical protein